MVRIPTHRPPVHPGEMLLEEFLLPMGISQRELADAIEADFTADLQSPISSLQSPTSGRLEIGD